MTETEDCRSAAEVHEEQEGNALQVQTNRSQNELVGRESRSDQERVVNDVATEDEASRGGIDEIDRLRERENQAN